MRLPKSKGKPKLPPPPRGGGAAGRQRQAELERGIRPPEGESAPSEECDQGEEGEKKKERRHK